MEIGAECKHWWRLTDEEIARLNPPEDAEARWDWLPLGFIPAPRTRLGMFFLHLMYGLWMHYPLHKVLGHAFTHTTTAWQVFDLTGIWKMVEGEPPDREIIEGEDEE